MSICNWMSDEKSVAVFVDTVMGVLPENRVAGFCSKAFPMPHLRMIVAGTGLGPLNAEWAMKLMTESVARDIVSVHTWAPAAMRAHYANWRERFPDWNGHHTFYHFGLTADGELLTLAYRAEEDFRGTPIGPGIAVKPRTAEPCIPEGRPCTVEDMVAIAKLQQAEDLATPADKPRVFIGGHLVMHHLTTDGIFSQVVHMFDNYESDWVEACGGLPERD